jgi:hypothetical protein
VKASLSSKMICVAVAFVLHTTKEQTQIMVMGANSGRVENMTKRKAEKMTNVKAINLKFCDNT